MVGSCSLNVGMLVVLGVGLAVTAMFGTFFISGGYAAKLPGLSSTAGLATTAKVIVKANLKYQIPHNVSLPLSNSFRSWLSLCTATYLSMINCPQLLQRSVRLLHISVCAGNEKASTSISQ